MLERKILGGLLILISLFLFSATVNAQSILHGQAAQQTQSNHTVIPSQPNQVLAVPNTMNYQAVAQQVSATRSEETAESRRAAIPVRHERPGQAAQPCRRGGVSRGEPFESDRQDSEKRRVATLRGGPSRYFQS